MSMSARSRSDEQSHYFAALNMMAELSSALASLDAPDAARAGLNELTAMCRADFEARFGRDRSAAARRR
ncbi:hypothetical protein GCM10023264_11660 [Sphingomonas daechungensis]|uniref:hypothetical protein n=1 Tax=Sphingomonas daechungensis TaxID=1176646 RepID=UPI0031ED06E2